MSINSTPTEELISVTQENQQVQDKNPENKTSLKNRVKGYWHKLRRSGQHEKAFHEMAEHGSDDINTKVTIEGPEGEIKYKVEDEALQDPTKLEQNIKIYERCVQYLSTNLKDPAVVATVISIGLGSLSMVCEPSAAIDPRVLAYVSSGIGAGALAYGKTKGHSFPVRAGAAIAGSTLGVGAVDALPAAFGPEIVGDNTAMLASNFGDDAASLGLATAVPGYKAARELGRRVSSKIRSGLAGRKH